MHTGRPRWDDVSIRSIVAPGYFALLAYMLGGEREPVIAVTSVAVAALAYTIRSFRTEAERIDIAQELSSKLPASEPIDDIADGICRRTMLRKDAVNLAVSATFGLATAAAGLWIKARMPF